MPEGPEIRRAADRVENAVAGKRLEKVFFEFRRLKRFQRILDGVEVSAVDTRGKAMLTRFNNGLTLYSHNQLYGRWYVVNAGKTPKTGRSLRVGLYTSDRSALLYSASDIEVLDENGLAKHPFLSRLGPDILDESLTDETVAERLDLPEFRRRSLGALYLDQGFLAGLGNYLRSEILHFAGLHPAQKPVNLKSSQGRKLARLTLSTARRSYRTKGVTNPPGRAAELKKKGLSYAKHRFAVFGREGRRCYVCKTPIERIDVSSRRLYFCPTCQSGGDSG